MWLVLEILRDIFIILVTLVCSFSVELLKNIWRIFVPKYKDLSNDVILITGAGNGIGRLMCLEFSKYCPTLVGWDVNKNALEETARMVTEQGGSVLRTYVCDLRSKENVTQTAERVLREVGRVTILVNNAGVVSGKRILDLQLSDIDNTFQVNVISHFYTIQAFLPAMIGSRRQVDGAGDVSEPIPRGHIVTIASIASLIPNPGLADYCASKAAALMMSDALELELKDANLEEHIHVTRICPFFINTTMFEGVKPLLSWLFPVLDADYTARQIVKAVRTNQRLLYIYRWQGLLPVVYRILPTKTVRRLFDLCGMSRFTSQLQEHRKGRQTEVSSAN